MSTWLLVLVLVNPVNGMKFTQAVPGLHSAEHCERLGTEWEARRHAEELRVVTSHKCVRS